MQPCDSHKTRVLPAGLLGEQIASILADTGSFTLTVTGSSMVPTLRDQRSSVELTAPQGSVKKGQILFFRRLSGEFLLHRAIRVEKDAITVCGDAQSWTEQIRPCQIIGVVNRICRDGRWYACGTLADKAYCALWGLTRPFRPAMFRMVSRLRH